MPHSGGGGSHGGGSSHSSHSSSGGSHSSGPSYTRGQSTPYPGARRYVYYHNHTPCYYYSDRPLTTLDFRSGYMGLIFIGAVWFILVTFICFMFFDRTEGGPIDTGGIDKTIYINDYADVINDEDEDRLKSRLEDFRSETGVIFAVVTSPVHNIGYDMETEAYNEYVSMFYDEQHWLIYYVGSDYDRTDDWSWNLMCGDDCSSVLDYRQEDNFVDEFHANLIRDMSFADAVIRAVDSLNPRLKPGYKYSEGVYVNGEYAGGQHVSSLIVYGAYAFALIGLVMVISGIKGLCKPISDENKSKMKATVVKDDEPVYIECSYCGGKVVKGTLTQCPYCSANLDL